MKYVNSFKIISKTFSGMSMKAKNDIKGGSEVITNIKNIYKVQISL